MDTLLPISTLHKELYKFFQLQLIKQLFQRRTKPTLSSNNKSIHFELFAHNRQSIGDGYMYQCHGQDYLNQLKPFYQWLLYLTKKGKKYANILMHITFGERESLQTTQYGIKLIRINQKIYYNGDNVPRCQLRPHKNIAFKLQTVVLV